MDLTPDDLAGIVDLFGALTHAELQEALTELAFRRGVDLRDGDVEAAIEEATDAFGLVALDGEPRLLAAGPGAFPQLPAAAEDLPHILDVERRSPDRRDVALAAEERFRSAAARAVAADDAEELERLLDASYDMEAWGPVDLADVRERIDEAAGSRVA